MSLPLISCTAPVEARLAQDADAVDGVGAVERDVEEDDRGVLRLQRAGERVGARQADAA